MTIAGVLKIDIIGGETFLGVPKFLKFSALSQSGVVSLMEDGINWDSNKLLISEIQVVIASGSSDDYEVEVYEKDDYTTNRRYWISGVDGSDGLFDLIGDLCYEDQDATKEVHLYVRDHDGTGAPQWNIYIYGLELR